MRMRHALIAILVALAAVAAGAQAAPSGSSSPSADDGNPANGTLIRGGGHNHFTQVTQVSLRTLRNHFGNDDPGSPASFEDIMNNDSRCRYPRACFFSDSNVGATSTNEPTMCSSTTYGSSVWFLTRPHHNGRLSFTIDGSATPNYFPSITIPSSFDPTTGPDFSTYGCNFADETQTFRVTHSDLFDIASGVYVEFGIGSKNNTPQGDFDFTLSWDPDTDGDNLLDSADSCDTGRGPQSLGGCPDTDGDKVVNYRDGVGTVDQCRTRFGEARFNGCPDTDGDGKSDHWDNGRVFDFCELKNPARLGRADVNDNGCPDWTELPNLSISPEGVVLHNTVIGVRWKRFRFSGRLPRGTKVTVSCRPRSHCKKRLPAGSALSRSVKRQLRKVKFVKFHTTITVKETKKGYIGKVFKIKVSFRRTGGGGRNLNVPPPRKRCIPATGGKSRKCTRTLRTLLDTLQ